MIPISPITIENITPHVGRPVCAVLHDGRRHFGVLRGIGDGQLYLDMMPGELTLASAKGTKFKQAPSARSAKAAKAKTKAWGYGPYGGWGWGWGFGAAAIGLAALAALFLIPFFFI